ncbi:hypothetical protein ACIQFP_00600 [Nocardiopsis alba]|uniref:hypothetical protein n=1 Tax=Nocardiopsis alba TaxID=53437 RepID=UPI0037F84631
MIKDKAVGADLGKLDDLQSAQETLINDFLGLMSQIWEQSGMTSSEWVGAGKEEFTGEATEFDEQFSQVISAFQKLATATGDSSASYASLMRRLDALF